MNRDPGRRASGRTRKRRIARDSKRGLGVGRGKGSGNGEEEEKNEVHGGGAWWNLVGSLTKRWRMIAGKNFGDRKNPYLRSGRQAFFLSAFKIIRQNKVSWMHAMVGSAIF